MQGVSYVSGKRSQGTESALLPGLLGTKVHLHARTPCICGTSANTYSAVACHLLGAFTP